ncbi:S41 family peptidase [Stratiformator vulcanicus]|uniref:Putative CtpA-like serine protease n=1 Tax=Stratiformator vulcanicus TaxID=2527980 RepID=A0A517R2R2_9PLAN|nr:S41 family peptidase [Stratiformator vulcanicus]QDT38176.1 putative CtpA-like serine protease [Stratiformator vulcanicus]
MNISTLFQNASQWAISVLTATVLAAPLAAADFGPAPSTFATDSVRSNFDSRYEQDLRLDRRDYRSRDNDRISNDRSNNGSYDRQIDYRTRKPVNDQRDRTPLRNYDELFRNRPIDRNLDRNPIDLDFGREPAVPTQPAEPTGVDLVDAKLSQRYGNPVTLRFIQSTSGQQFVNLYMEISRMIDARHYEPTSYQDRVAQAVTNLKRAVSNPEFQRAYNLNPSRDRIAAFERGVDECIASRSISNANDAMNAMYCVANVASSTLNLGGTAVAAEFVYGATESLDKYSAFLPEDPSGRQGAVLDVPGKTAGVMDTHVVGIGVEIKPHDNGIIVVRALRGGPAEAGGVERGDVITSINGQSLKGRSLDYAVDLITGPIGSPVMLGIAKANGASNSVTLRRAQVELRSVSEAKMIDSRAGVGYIKLDKFAATTDKEMDEALWDLHNKGMKSLVFDLRGNPGGLLTTAISVSNKFLPSGGIVSTKGRTAEDNMSESASRARTWKVPLVVLVDENSASASEIFAAAIQDNRRGVVVGRRSYGKGTVQTHFPVSTVRGNLKITTALFYSPTGRKMAGAGVTPDIEVRDGNYDLLKPLTQDVDVIAAHKAATGNDVREMASAAERGVNYDQLSRR